MCTILPLLRFWFNHLMWVLSEYCPDLHITVLEFHFKNYRNWSTFTKTVFYVVSHFIFSVGHKGQTHCGFICLWSREVAIFQCIIYFMTKVLIHYMKFWIGPLLINQCQNWEFNTKSASGTNETDCPTIFLWHILVDTLCNMAVWVKAQI